MPYQLLRIYITSLYRFFAAHVYLLIIRINNQFRVAIINTVTDFLSNLFTANESLEHLFSIFNNTCYNDNKNYKA